ncbi:hypothetical protein AX15_003530 [Amanita polypyramis BW_CC]|nr:hypothetical protein AX15_003530 [Amanita polypyramis BW_CC]
MNILKSLFRPKRHSQQERASSPRTTQKKSTDRPPQTRAQKNTQKADAPPPHTPTPSAQQPNTSLAKLTDIENRNKNEDEGRSAPQPNQLPAAEEIRTSGQKYDHVEGDNQSETEVGPPVYDDRKIATLPPQVQASKHDDLKDALKVAKSGFTLALEVTSKVIAGLPIPGAKGAIDITLQIMKGIDVTSANMERIKELQGHITYILDNALTPLSNMAGDDIPLGLRADVEKLSIQLKTLMEEWASFSSRWKIRRFVQATGDEDGLKGLTENIRLAIEKFQLSCQVRGQISNAQQEKLLLVIASDKVFEKRSDLVTKLPRAVEAGYNSGRAGGPSSCLEGTRVAILETVKSWVTNSDSSQPRLFWLNGLAGIGKSTVAKTIAEYADNRGILGGSFFFSRDDEQLRKSSLVFPTLAYQLAQSSDIFKSSIGEALQRDVDFGHRSRQIQLEELIVRPLIRSGLSDRKHIVLLVIDALDECAPEDEAAEILQLLLAHISRVPFAFRVLLTSRPEHHIRNIFDENHNHAKYILHDIEESIVRSDIHLFVESSLQALPKQLKWPPKGEWPPGVEMETLVEKSGKLFVYAATSLRFIGNTRVRNPRKQLEVLLGARAAVNAKPYAQLDQLYLQVLRSALPKDTEEDLILRFHWVVGSIVLLRNPLSIRSLACFIQYEEDDVLDALYHLHSIILTPSTIEQAPRIYHPSFPDFITDASRCSDPIFLVDIPTHEKRLVLRCLEVMLSVLRRDILELGDYSDLNDGIDSLSELIAEQVPAEVRYSCRHWASHLIKVAEGDEEVTEALTHFAFHKLLNWFEIMSWS